MQAVKPTVDTSRHCRQWLMLVCTSIQRMYIHLAKRIRQPASIDKPLRNVAACRLQHADKGRN